jgi:glycine betaine/proline transport system permease protein
VSRLTRVPLGDWVAAGVSYLERTFAPSFGAFSNGADALVGGLGALLAAPPAWFAILAVAAALWRVSGPRTSLLCALALLLVVNLGLWDAFVLTLTLVLAAEVLVVLLGLPLGVLMALSDTAQRALTPLLDAMQTMPSFVYLIPAVTFFGLGLVPGVVATVVFALPPLVRLTNLGLRQVPKDIVEAAEAFGGTRWQRLLKVELPAARPTLLAGINQSIMLSLSMVVIAALIGAGGLGQEVIRGMNTLDIALGFEAGLAIVIMAVVLDRLTQPRRRERVGARFSGRAGAERDGRSAKPEAP